METELVGIVERLTGRRVRALVSGTNVSTDTSTEVFLLEAPTRRKTRSGATLCQDKALGCRCAAQCQVDQQCDERATGPRGSPRTLGGVLK
jgi:hypothetical protein